MRTSRSPPPFAAAPFWPAPFCPSAGAWDARDKPAGGLTGLLPGPVLGGAALEALDATAGVDQLLLARVEGVALGAELYMQVLFRGPGVELVAARAVHVRKR